LQNVGLVLFSKEVIAPEWNTTHHCTTQDGWMDGWMMCGQKTLFH
jgi:hypothetical protein